MLGFKWLLMGALLQFSLGCASFSTLQTANTLKPGGVKIGGGSVYSPEDGVFYPEVGGRVGVFDRVDVGMKYVFPQLLFVDAKGQLWKGPVNVAADAGFSYFSYTETDVLSSTVLGFYPMLLVGQEHWYAGAKAMILSVDGKWSRKELDDFSSTGWVSTNFVVGASLGGKVRFVPELNLALTKDNQIHLFPAAAIQVDVR